VPSHPRAADPTGVGASPLVRRPAIVEVDVVSRVATWGWTALLAEGTILLPCAGAPVVYVLQGSVMIGATWLADGLLRSAGWRARASRG
jgi:hypothetical protein